jgi:hypothetical protein
MGPLLPAVWGHTPATREMKSTVSAIPEASPQKCYGNLKMRYRTLKQFNRKQHFIVPAQTQWAPITLYTLASKLQKQEARFNPYMGLESIYEQNM